MPNSIVDFLENMHTVLRVIELYNLVRSKNLHDFGRFSFLFHSLMQNPKNGSQRWLRVSSFRPMQNLYQIIINITTTSCFAKRTFPFFYFLVKDRVVC